MEWSLKAKELSAQIPKNQDTYWYAQYQSNELLLIAFILERNFEATVATGNTYVEAALNAKVDVGAFHIINNLSYIARIELGPDAAIEVLSLALPNLEDRPNADQEILYYALGKNLTYVGEYEKALSYYEKLDGVLSRPDITRAYRANVAYVYSKVGQPQKAMANAQIARDLFGTSLENEFGQYILKTEKNIALQNGDLKKAIEIDNEIDRIGELLSERAISSNRTRLSKSLQVTRERQKRESEALAYESQLNAERADARQNQLFMASIALFFLMGLVAYIFRSYRREQRLNTEIQITNDDLEEANANLNSANTTLTKTFQELKVAHKRALAGQEAKEKFIGVIGHELRTPLNPIINLAGVLEGQATNKREKVLLKAIKNAGKRLHIIVENMLAISSGDDETRIFIEPVDVADNTATIVKEFTSEIQSKNAELRATGESIKVNVFKEAGISPMHYSNKVIYRSIVRNLFDNALKFTRSGEIAIEIRKRKDGAGFLFSIRDTGVGMDAAKIDELIEPFSQAEMDLTRAYEGAGLGLAVVHKYCEQLGAKMKISSTVNLGTKIMIDFPEPSYEHQTGELLKVA